MAGLIAVPIMVPAEMVTVGSTAAGVLSAVKEKRRTEKKDTIAARAMMPAFAMIGPAEELLLVLACQVYLYTASPRRLPLTPDQSRPRRDVRAQEPSLDLNSDLQHDR